MTQASGILICVYTADWLRDHSYLYISALVEILNS